MMVEFLVDYASVDALEGIDFPRNCWMNFFTNDQMQEHNKVVGLLRIFMQETFHSRWRVQTYLREFA